MGTSARRYSLMIGFLLLLGNGILISAPVERSVSASRQFVVYGTTTPLRGAVATVAEQTKATVLSVLQQRDNWKIPIVLHLQFPQANIPELTGTSLRFSQTGAGLKIQLDLTITTDFDILALRRQLLRMLLLEMIYRDHQDLSPGSFYVEPPDWLVEALAAANSLPDLTGIFEAVNGLVEADKIQPLEEFLRQKVNLLDSPGQLLYRGYALAFLKLLLNQPNGPARVANYVSTLSRASADPVADLKERFPLLIHEREAEVVWKASVSDLALHHYELLTTTESERRLDELIGSPDGSVKSAINLASFAKKRISKPELIELRELKEKLMLLTIQANPIVRPLVMEYQWLVDRIIARKIKGLAPHLVRLDAKRQQMRARTTGIDDYMNWFEATKSGTASGAFTGYLRAAAGSNELPSRRRDPLSVYLDALEEQF